MTDPSPDLESDDIKSMGLYHHVDRVGSEVRDLGRSDDEPLRADELTAFDQLHYHGTEAVDEAVRSTGINQQSAVLEVGSGSRNENGKLEPLDVKKGDKILFGKWSVSQVKMKGE